MPKIDIAALEVRSGSNYPDPFNEICLGPTWKKLGDAVGLTDFGVNLVRLTPGKWSSQRHWHTVEDERAILAGSRAHTHAKVAFVEPDVRFSKDEGRGRDAGARFFIVDAPAQRKAAL